ncbi:MAG TPA: Pr6Pr family membrane protein [Pseudolysinimonas sp.]|nr:Pr6Pr family membrane protein [Pseudolysinimonas sp.]
MKLGSRVAFVRGARLREVGVDVRILYIVFRLAGAAVITAAIAGQYLHSLNFRADHGIDENGVPAVNFFSFFTVESNVLTIAVFLVGAVLLIRSSGTDPLWFGVARAGVTAYMATTGIVYNTLLRGVEVSEGATLGWSNEILHVVGPLLVVVDWLFAPGRRWLEWNHIRIIVIFPIVWAVYTMIRGPFVDDPTQAVLNPNYTGGWYPYPFLNPANSPELGYVSVAFYVVLIAAVIGGVGAAVIWVSRRNRWPLPAPKA